MSQPFLRLLRAPNSAKRLSINSRKSSSLGTYWNEWKSRMISRSVLIYIFTQRPAFSCSGSYTGPDRALPPPFRCSQLIARHFNPNKTTAQLTASVWFNADLLHLFSSPISRTSHFPTLRASRLRTRRPSCLRSGDVSPPLNTRYYYTTGISLISCINIYDEFHGCNEQ